MCRSWTSDAVQRCQRLHPPAWPGYGRSWRPVFLRYTQTIAKAFIPLLQGSQYIYLIATNQAEMRAIGTLREMSEPFQKPALMLGG